MIKFTINPEKEAKTHIFKKENVVIGGANSYEADLRLTLDHLKHAHIKISKESDGSYSCTNLANDPFVTINEIPFGKKTLKHCDLIQIDETVIRFEILEEPQIVTSTKKQAPPSPKLFSEERIPLDLSDDLFGKSDDHSLDEMDIEELVKEIEQLDKEGDALASEGEELDHDLSFTEEPKTVKKHISIVDLPDNEKEESVENDDETESPPKHEVPKKRTANRKLKPMFVLLLGTATLLLMLFNGVVIRIQEKNHRKEIQAAASLADIALALTYAQINHVKPEQQNWTDPTFLKNSIAAVLSPYHESVADIDMQGRINNGQYLLRIYTNRDLSRFLVLAQPEPSLMQWIAPQESIAIDSSTMELHQVPDLKPLNRLLVNQDSLGGESGQEIAKFINRGKLIPLASLANKNNRNGFMPPKGLETVREGAENYVYNAPRYSQVGDNIIHDAIELSSRGSTSNEVKRIHEQLGVISHFPYAVLYTSKGKQVAIKGQKALNTLIPNQKFLIAYLNFNEDGIVEGSQLIPEGLSPKNAPYAAITMNPHVEEKEVAMSQPLALTDKTNEIFHQPKKTMQVAKNDFNVSPDPSSPLYQQIKALADERQEELKPIAAQIIDLITQNTESQQSDFNVKIDHLLAKYQESSEDQSEAIIVTLKELYAEYETMPLSEFLEYVKTAGLASIAESHLIALSKEKAAHSLTDEEFNRQLEKIAATETFEDLYATTQETAQELKLYNIPNTSRLILYQNKMRTQVLEKLNEMLFSPDSSLTEAELNATNRQILQKILQVSWISDTEEQNFYMNEYDLLVEDKERKAASPKK